MIEPTRPNFFLLLELNPDEPWDQTLYQKALQDKIRQWSRESMGIAKKALPAQANRALLPQIRKVMEDPILCEKEANDAKNLRYVRYQTTHAQFEKQLILLNLKEFAEPEEIERFIKDFKDIIPAQEIQKRIKIKVQTSDHSDTYRPQPLDISMAKNIGDRLEIIQMQTLYELLQSPRKSTSFSLFQAAEELYAREVRKHPTAEVTARVELAGSAMSLFKTDETRARYDETLRQMSLQQLLKDITESVKRSTTKEVHPKQVLYYMQKAAETGWSEEEALAKLKEHGRIHQWFITIPQKQLEKPQTITRTPPSPVEARSSPQNRKNTKPVYQLYYRIVNKNTWRRLKASTMLFFQLVCFIALTQAQLDPLKPIIQLLNWGNQARIWMLALSIKNIQQIAQPLLLSYFSRPDIHFGISLIMTIIINSISVALILTPGIPILCILIGLLNGSSIGLKNLSETLIKTHREARILIAHEMDTASRSTHRNYAFDRGWQIEEQVTENLSVTFRNLNQRWFNAADILTDWKWRRNRFIRYWIHLTRIGCHLAGLMQYGLSIEFRSLCTGSYTLFLLLWGTATLICIAFLLLIQALYRSLHQGGINCPSCHQNISTPIYICSICKTEQSQSGPTLSGIFSYHCKGCEVKLPTLHRNREESLTRLCPRCHGLLHY